MNENLIEVGDTVDIEFDTATNIQGYEVLSIPLTEGECWILVKLTEHDRILIYLKSFAIMRLVKKKIE